MSLHCLREKEKEKNQRKEKSNQEK